MSGINFAALKAKLNQFNGQGQRQDALWKPTKGKTTVRLLPWKDDRSNPFIELHFHYLGNKTYLSPNTWGNRDPIAEFAENIAAEGTKDSWQQAKAFRPKLRTYVPIIVRGEEDKGVRFMSFGKTVYTELLEMINDADYGDIFDVQAGHDIVVDYTPQEESDTNFAKTVVRPKPAKTPLSTDAALVQKWLTEQPDIKAIFKEPTFEELNVVLARYLNPDEDVPVARTPAATASATTSRSNTRAEKSEASVKGAVDDFDAVFQ